jgi:hypothetical protein
MPTGQQIITRAVTALNIIDDGGSISASESAGLLIELNAMVDAWSCEETLIPSVSTAQYQLTANQNPYPIGPAAVAPFNVARPVRIDSAYLVSTVGSGNNRNDLRLVGSKEYFAHNDLSASATGADELYADWADSETGAMNLYLYPVPTCPTVTKLELQTWNAIQAFALGVNQNLPNGYEDAIVYALAFRCLREDPERAESAALSGPPATTSAGSSGGGEVARDHSRPDHRSRHRRLRPPVRLDGERKDEAALGRVLPRFRVFARIHRFRSVPARLVDHLRYALFD